MRILMKLSKEIWVIDDDAYFQLLAGKTLQKIDNDILLIKYNDGEDAILSIKERIEQSKPLPDLIFLDINMPLTSGWEFLDMFQTLISQITTLPEIYLISSSIFDLDFETARSYDFLAGHLIKPIYKEKLEEILNSL